MTEEKYRSRAGLKTEGVLIPTWSGRYRRKAKLGRQVPVPENAFRREQVHAQGRSAEKDGITAGYGGRPMKNYASCIIGGLTWQDAYCPVVRA